MLACQRKLFPSSNSLPVKKHANQHFSQCFDAIVPQTGDCLKKQASVAGILYVLHDMAEKNCGKLMHDDHGKFRRTALTFCQDTFTLFGCY